MITEGIKLKLIGILVIGLLAVFITGCLPNGGWIYPEGYNESVPIFVNGSEPLLPENLTISDEVRNYTSSPNITEPVDNITITNDNQTTNITPM